jgi:potassium-dependent mechanosensitive channel
LKKGDRAQSMTKSLVVTGFTVILFLATTSGESFGQTSGAQPPPAAPLASTAIPLAEVATRSAEVISLLTTFSEKSTPSLEIEKIRQSLPEVVRQIDLAYIDTSAALGELAPLATMQAMRTHWQRRHLQVRAWFNLLTQQAVELAGALERLARIKETWIQTREAAVSDQAPVAIIEQIQATLVSLETVQLALKTQEEAVLLLQGNIARELARCNEAMTQIDKAQKSAVEGILLQENPPIWSLSLWGHARTELPNRMRNIARSFWTNIKEYAGDPYLGMPLHAALLLVMTMAFYAARLKKRKWIATGVGVSAAVRVFDYPYSAALTIVLLVATAVHSPAPARVKGILSALILVPVIRLVRPVIDIRLAPGIYTVAILYAVDLFRQMLGGAPLVEQALLIVENLTAIAVLKWLPNPERLRRTTEQAPNGFRVSPGPILSRVLMLCLSAGFLAAVIGFMRLARLITSSILVGGILALSLYAFVRVANGVVSIALRVWPLQGLQIVLKHCDRMERWIHRLLVWTAAVFGTDRFLEYLGVLDPVLSVAGAVLSIKLERGAFSISVGDILAFGLTVWAAYLLSTFIRFALQEEVYPRRGVARGLSYAYSRLIHYVILAVGFLVGLAVLGMDLTKVSVLVGAFGVGIGFGLQDVVKNFVCGLILLFERPVQVGDEIEVGSLQGEVRRIGIRASTVRSYHGADIIVPNSQLITANVTNWTHSDQLRRIDLPVGLNYGASPQKVIEILEAVARANPAVLEHPSPLCLLQGYGDSSINFELRVWTDQFDRWVLIRSELASAVFEAVKAAGMSFPFPQREVRVIGDSGRGNARPLQTEERRGTASEGKIGEWKLLPAKNMDKQI